MSNSRLSPPTLCLLLAAFLSPLQQIHAQEFDSPLDLTAGTSPLGTALADLDGDGRQDLLSTIYDGAALAIFPNTGTAPGALSFGARLDFATGSHPEGLLVADLDGDGRADTVTANAGSSNISIYRNASTAGNISLTDRLDLPVNTAHRVAAGDFDGDAKLDLAVTSNAASQIRIFHNTSSPGTISFTQPLTLGTALFPNSIAVGDVDLDGKPDILAPVQSSNVLSIYINQSSGGSISFASPVNVAAGASANGVGLGDFDGDGKVDVAVANPGAGSVSLFLNQSTPGVLSLAARQDFPAGPSSSDLALGDFDRDGRLDVVVTNYDAGTDDELVILRNTAAPFGLSLHLALTTGSTPYLPAVGDVDGDGFLDIAASNHGGTTVSVFRNSSGTGSFFTLTPCRAVDTRSPNGPYGGPILTSGQSRLFTLHGLCGIPAMAKAVMLNVTIAGGSSAGFLTFYPGGQTPPATSTITFPPSIALSNNTIQLLSTNGALGIQPFVGNNGQVHVIVDVSGYFE